MKPMTPPRRNALTPEALLMMDTIARTGSFAAAARELGKVPSALTYSVRQLEDAQASVVPVRTFLGLDAVPGPVPAAHAPSEPAA